MKAGGIVEEAAKSEGIQFREENYFRRDDGPRYERREGHEVKDVKERGGYGGKRKEDGMDVDGRMWMAGYG